MSSDETPTPRVKAASATKSAAEPTPLPDSVPRRSAWRGEVPDSATAFISAISIVVALGAAAVWGLVAVAHSGDAYLLTHVSGHRMALAQYLGEGVFYPPLYEEGHYGGTRIMPLSILLHAMSAGLTGEYVASGRVLSLAIVALLSAVVFTILRRLGSAPAVAAVLSVSVLLVEPGYRVGFSALTADGLAVLLQLLAVWSVASHDSRTRTVTAAALSAAAFMTKFSALWAPIAIVIWLALRHRRALWLFASAYVLLVAVLLGATNVASEGRFFENLFGLSLAGVDGIGAAVHSPTRFIRILFGNTPALWAISPVATVAVFASLARRAPSIYDVALIVHVPLLFVIFTDIGADANHLLDLAVLSILAIGHASSYTEAAADPKSLPAPLRSLRLTAVQGAVALLAFWMLVTHLVVYVPDVYVATASLESAGRPTRPLERWVTASHTILSEDPYVPVALGQVPVVADPFMLIRIGHRNPEAIRALVNRIEAREFDVVILTAPLDRTWWWERFHFGSNVMAAVEHAYELSANAEGYYLYAPRE